ncbi:MAG: DUF423 domain-containing protein [Gemmatimonadales bacterium]|nr:DUF423 domain-containing protein [Gemmatimonadales bacterium]
MNARAPAGWVALGAVLAGLAVLAGAFGAHALRGTLSPDDLGAFETAARYQMYHGLALLAVGSSLSRTNDPLIHAAGLCFGFGVLLFSGSLYALALSGLSALGAVTPFGGVALVAGWGCLAWGTIRGSRSG